jgi:2-dehydro-3-deoxygalactonokinase
MTASCSHIVANLDGNRLQVWRIAADGTSASELVALADSDAASLAAALRNAMGDSAVPVLLAGSTLVPPVAVPGKPSDLRPKEIELEGLTVHALPGLCQNAPAGVILGATARIEGFLRLNPNWDGVICLPGPVNHWVHVSAREVVSFQGALTWPLAQSLADTMRLDSTGPFDRSALTQSAADSLAKPETLAARLASVQAEALVGQTSKEVLLGQLMGTLIGAELAAARPYWLGQNLALIAEPLLQSPYAAVLEAQALPVTLADPDRMCLEGLKRAWEDR